MANGTRTVVVVIALAAGLAVGWLTGCEKTQPPPQPTPVPLATLPPPTPTAVRHPYVTPAPPYPKAQPWNVIVGPSDPCKVTRGGNPVDVMTISKTWGHSITFESTGAEKLGILLYVPAGTEQPFKSVAYVGPEGDLDVWALECNGSRQKCVTGGAQTAGSPNLYIKVYQILDRQKPCDAGIIIQP